MKKRLLTVLMTFVMMMSFMPMLDGNVYALEDTGNATLNAFMNDGRFTDGASWAWNKGPMIASFGSQGCCAYCADYVKYCYGINNPRSGSAFYNTSEIRAGDVLTVGNQSDGTGHWFVCMKRSGNNLYVAEGNVSNRVRIGWNYTISGSKSFSQDSRSFTAGYHYLDPFDPTPSTPQGSEMASGYDRTIPDGDYLIVNAGTTDKASFYYLDIEGTYHPALNDTNVSLCGPLSGSKDVPAYEIWTLTYSNGFYKITQKDTNMALDVYCVSRDAGANVQVANSYNNSAQKWAISRNGRDGYRLQAKCSGYSLDLVDGKIASGTNIRQWPSNDSDAQSWLFIPYKPEQPINDGRYVILSMMDNSLELDVSGDSGSIPENTNVQIWKDTAPSKYNSFDVKKLDNGYYSIIHAASGKSLDVTNGVSTYGSNVAVHNKNGSVAQQWAITKDGNGFIIQARCSGYSLDVKGAGKTDGTNVEQYPYNVMWGQGNQTWRFVPAEYYVKYNANGGSNAPSAQTKYYKENLILTTVVPKNTNATFKGWNTKADGTGTYYAAGAVYTEDSDLTLYAEWVSNPSSNDTTQSASGNSGIASIVSANEVVDLPAVKISNAKGAKKAATVKWKKVSKKNQKKIAKVQIQYSTDKTFTTDVKSVLVKKTATSKKIKKLASKKQYYFRVRAYKKVGAVEHISKWSKVKKAKVR